MVASAAEASVWEKAEANAPVAVPRIGVTAVIWKSVAVECLAAGTDSTILVAKAEIVTKGVVFLRVSLAFAVVGATHPEKGALNPRVYIAA